jgi:hypothetical protein
VQGNSPPTMPTFLFADGIYENVYVREDDHWMAAARDFCFPACRCCWVVEFDGFTAFPKIRSQQAHWMTMSGLAERILT